MGKNLLPVDIRDVYQVEERHHACDLFFAVGEKTAAGIATPHMSESIPKMYNRAKKSGISTLATRPRQGILFEEVSPP